MFLLPRPRRELASVLAPTTRRATPRKMAPPRSRRRDQPRASGERRSAATMRRDVPADLEHLECGHQPHAQDRGAEKRLQLAGRSASGCGQESPSPGGCAVAGP